MEQDKFQNLIDEIEESNLVTDEQFNYLEKKLERKGSWAKCYIKTKFNGGISTTSRVEGLHAVQKKFINSSSSLLDVFKCFRLIEKRQISKFENEFLKHNNEDAKKASNSINSLKEIKENFSQYFYKKIYSKFTLALNYACEKINSKSW